MNANKKLILSASVVIAVLAVSVGYYVFRMFLSDLNQYSAGKHGMVVLTKEPQQSDNDDLQVTSSNADVSTNSQAGENADIYSDVVANNNSDELGIYIVGEVQLPGFYLLPAGSRVFDAVSAAGGMTADAASETINLAEYIRDQQKIVILSKTEASAYESVNAAANTAGNTTNQAIVNGIVNINIANVEQLCTLPGIGPVTAQGIIDFRETNGPFKSKADIKDVRRIGEKTYANIESLISVD